MQAMKMSVCLAQCLAQDTSEQILCNQQDQWQCGDEQGQDMFAAKVYCKAFTLLCHIT